MDQRQRSALCEDLMNIENLLRASTHDLINEAFPRYIKALQNTKDSMELMWKGVELDPSIENGQIVVQSMMQQTANATKDYHDALFKRNRLHAQHTKLRKELSKDQEKKELEKQFKTVTEERSKEKKEFDIRTEQATGISQVAGILLNKIFAPVETTVKTLEFKTSSQNSFYDTTFNEKFDMNATENTDSDQDQSEKSKKQQEEEQIAKHKKEKEEREKKEEEDKQQEEENEIEKEKEEEEKNEEIKEDVEDVLEEATEKLIELSA